jgi:hypothetical protein
MPQGVILFPSIHFALRAEKMMKEKAISYKLIPVPRHLSSDCGVCLRISWEKKDEVIEVLAQAGVKVDGAHALTGGEKFP